MALEHLQEQIVALSSLTSSPYEAIRDVDELVRAIDSQNCTPGWVPRQEPLMWPTAQSRFIAAHWRYAEIRPALLAAGRVIGTDLAERRNFVLRNPIPGNDFATTRTLVGAYQSILPGETARSHRHSSHALRVIIEARGAYSVVNGRKHPMETGDVVLTPGGHWHGHGHDGDEQAFWFDCLDLPLVHLLEPMKAEDHPEHWEAGAENEPRSPMRLAWHDIQARLDEVREVDRHFGATVDLTSLLMPTITIKAHRWAAGGATWPTATTPTRSSWCCAEAERAQSPKAASTGRSAMSSWRRSAPGSRTRLVRMPCWSR